MKQDNKNLIFNNIWQTTRVVIVIFFVSGLIFILSGVTLQTMVNIIIISIPIISIHIVLKSLINISELSKLKQLHNFNSDKQLPNANNLIEYEYQRIIKDTRRKDYTQINELNKSRKNMHNQYVTWMHNIKVPIAALELIIENSDVESNEYNRIQVQIDTIKRYLSEMLNLVSLGNGNNDLKIEEVDMNNVVKNILKRNSWMIISKQQSLKISSNLPFFISDKRWLEIMIEQIIINASKYTPEKGIIYIESDNEKNIVIRDNGIGMYEKDVKRIFETGFTGEIGRECIEATGLGLYLVGEIAKKLCVTIKVSSEKGKGSVFTITNNKY
ncbi:MAG: sensor histidine kinase [Lactobacillaceae bacterium]